VRARWTAFGLAIVVGLYLVAIGWRGVLLLGSDSAVGVGLGAGLLVLPLVGAWAVIRELGFGRATQRLADDLAAAGGLPVDELPRRPSGRVERPAADALFAQCRAEVDAAPDDAGAWFRLACAYDVAGDRRRARAAMRHAVALHTGRVA
jgi:cytochrome c-type biogenesis protein CcmH/NrfG